MYRELNLEDLAQLSGSAMVADESSYRAASPAIAERWAKFQVNPKLRALFPTVETQADLWDAIKRAMRFFGFQSEGKNIRVETSEPARNGSHTDGRPRFSKSRSVYFVSWLPHEVSGSKFFQDNYETVIEALRERRIADRAKRKVDLPEDIAA